MKDILADALLYAVLLIAGAAAGMAYEASRNAHADKAELQDQQKRTARTTAWLRDTKASNDATLNQRIADLQDQLSTTQGQANENHHTLVAGVRAGTVSVRVPIVPASCSSDSIRTTDGAAPATEPTYAQLDPEAAADLAAIPHEGDAAIRELNACITQYNAVRQSQQDWLASLAQLERQHDQTP